MNQWMGSQALGSTARGYMLLGTVANERRAKKGKTCVTWGVGKKSCDGIVGSCRKHAMNIILCVDEAWASSATTSCTTCTGTPGNNDAHRKTRGKIHIVSKPQENDTICIKTPGNSYMYQNPGKKIQCVSKRQGNHTMYQNPGKIIHVSNPRKEDTTCIYL